LVPSSDGAKLMIAVGVTVPEVSLESVDSSVPSELVGFVVPWGESLAVADGVNCRVD